MNRSIKLALIVFTLALVASPAISMAQGNGNGNAGTNPNAGPTKGGPAATTTAVSAPTIIAGADGTVTASVTAASGTPAGSVTLVVDSSSTFTGTLDTNGRVSFVVPHPSAGSHTLSAAYGGSSTYAASSVLSALQAVAITVVPPEAFIGAMSASSIASFIGSATPDNWTKLAYTANVQNTNPSLFNMGADGSLVINKSGVISVSATISTTPNSAAANTAMQIQLNTQPMVQAWNVNPGPPNTVIASLNVAVNAGDTLTFLAIPSQIASMPVGTQYEVLSVSWQSR